MQEILLIHESTPNPNSIRVISNSTFSTNSISFSERSGIDLVDRVLEIEGIESLFLFDNFITLNKSAEADWNNIIDRAKELIKDYLPFHDPDIRLNVEEEKIEYRAEVKEDIEKIEKILDKHVRPSLQGDGGDLRIIDLVDNVLEIKYLGACSSCPSSIMGTLKGIEGVLQNEFNKEIKVKANNQMDIDIFY